MHIMRESISMLQNKEMEHSAAVSTKGGSQKSPGQLGAHTDGHCPLRVRGGGKVRIAFPGSFDMHVALLTWFIFSELCCGKSFIN